MKLLLDTHILLWAAANSKNLPAEAVQLLNDPMNELLFSAASIWEITIKHGLGRPDFRADPGVLRRGLLDNGYTPLPLTSEHALAIGHLPKLHRDPFDRALIAQAIVEGIVLVTADAIVATYPGSIMKI